MENMFKICLLCSVSEVTVLRDLLDRYIHPSSSDPIARHRWVGPFISGWNWTEVGGAWRHDLVG